MKWRVLALCLGCWTVGFGAAWAIRADDTDAATTRAHAADLTQEGASMMVDDLSRQLYVCELGLKAADAALYECGEERELLHGEVVGERLKCENMRRDVERP